MSDRYLYFALPIFLGASFFAVRYALTDIIELTELPPKQAASERRKDKPEDDISVATLLTLSRSPNPNIANSAIQLVVARYAEMPDACETLRKERFSLDERVSRQCNATIDFLLAWPNTSQPLRECVRGLRTPRAWEDIVEEAKEWANRQETPPETPPTFYEGVSGDVDGVVMLNFGGIGDGPSDDMDEEERRRQRREAVVMGAGSVEE
ncbi:hypothetical protein LTR17_013774 [Elasticomyces elasticus]|nr:hypothetical protein LTR17_013774 [Elasticomyces elasticus]